MGNAIRWQGEPNLSRFRSRHVDGYTLTMA
jgi:hypothetical protein